jgi:DNA-binding phage protein
MGGPEACPQAPAVQTINSCGNPQLDTILKVMRASGLRLHAIAG